MGWKVESVKNEGIKARYIIAEDGSIVATVNHFMDAPLIASAPDIYEALKHTQTVLYNLKVVNIGELTQQQLLLEKEVVKALAKAEGKGG